MAPLQSVLLCHTSRAVLPLPESGAVSLEFLRRVSRLACHLFRWHKVGCLSIAWVVHGITEGFVCDRGTAATSEFQRCNVLLDYLALANLDR